MKGSEIYAALPSGDKNDLVIAIWNQLNAGNYITPSTMPIVTSAKGHTATIWVATDAIHLGEPGDSFRPMISPVIADALATKLGFYLPTGKIVREVYKQGAIKVSMKNQNASSSDRVACCDPSSAACAEATKRLGSKPRCLSPSMGDKAAMKTHSDDIDKGAGFTPGAATFGVMLSDVGKAWINDAKRYTKDPNGPNQGCNHGWYDKGAPYKDIEQLSAWQIRGTKHPAGTNVTTDPGHFDYSQTASYFVHPKVLVDGGTSGEQWMDFAAVLADPTLSYLVNDEGPLPKAHPYYSGGSTSGIPSVVGDDPAQTGQASTSSLVGYAVVGAVALGLFFLTLKK